jgi:hypothetical protein
MTQPDYKRALDAACREWEQLAQQRSDLDKRLGDLQRSIVTLTRLCGYEASVPFGLSDACRLILMRHPNRALSAQEMRNELDMMGLDLSKHASPLASIHVTLKRLVSNGLARFIPGGDGTAPRYISKMPARSVVAYGHEHAKQLFGLHFGAAAPVPPIKVSTKKGKKR